MALRKLNLQIWHKMSREDRKEHLNILFLQGKKDPAWISLAEGSRPRELFLESTPGKPLSGVPFAVKDNIDVAGMETTAACPSFAYTAQKDAAAVALLRAAGAIPVGKSNLDQFATGLNGTRSPYGAVPNPWQPDMICGGSSSGSASLVARGLVPFALGTDTAGSGRVPAGLNGIVGLKPTRGWWSTRGVVPASPSLDCVSLLTQTVEDAALLAPILGCYDPEDPYSRRKPLLQAQSRKYKLGYLGSMDFDGDETGRRNFEASLATWRWLGYQTIPVDPGPFQSMAKLLYQGPWLAERAEALSGMYPSRASELLPVLRDILSGAGNLSARDAFQAYRIKQELQREIEEVLAPFDALVVPTIPRPYTIKEIENDPIILNNKLGTYSNFVNLADLCGLSLPTGLFSSGVPFGITLLAPAWHDSLLLSLGLEWQRTAKRVLLAAVGAHMKGLALNHLLTARGGCLVEEATTSKSYKLFALSGQEVPKPGLLRAAGGSSIALEVWSLPEEALGAVTAETPPPLGIGNVELADGRIVKGFLCEPYAVESAQDITGLGGWRTFIHGA